MVLSTGTAEKRKLTVIDKEAAGRAYIRQLMPVQFGLLETVR